MGYIAFILPVLCALIQNGIAIKCYNCVSKPDDNCEDVLAKHVIPCNSLPHNSFSPVCVKKVVRDATGNINVTRQCIQSGETGQECEAPSINYKVISCSMCATDLCNSAPDINCTKNIFFGLIAATFLYFIIPNI